MGRGQWIRKWLAISPQNGHKLFPTFLIYLLSIAGYGYSQGETTTSSSFPKTHLPQRLATLISSQKTVVSTHLLHVPGVPKAYNASIVEDAGGYRLTFRLDTPSNVRGIWYKTSIGEILFNMG